MSNNVAPGNLALLVIPTDKRTWLRHHGPACLAIIVLSIPTSWRRLACPTISSYHFECFSAVGLSLYSDSIHHGLWIFCEQAKKVGQHPLNGATNYRFGRPLPNQNPNLLKPATHPKQNRTCLPKQVPGKNRRRRWR
jgi:hypothetical protein